MGDGPKDKGRRVEDMPEGPVVYTMNEVAALLKVHRNTVENWVRSGRLPVQRLGHRTVRIRREDLEAFLGTAGETPASPAPD
jgi:excisionase family DNA binding protein